MPAPESGLATPPTFASLKTYVSEIAGHLLQAEIPNGCSTFPKNQRLTWGRKYWVSPMWSPPNLSLRTRLLCSSCENETSCSWLQPGLQEKAGMVTAYPGTSLVVTAEPNFWVLALTSSDGQGPPSLLKLSSSSQQNVESVGRRPFQELST